MVLDPTSNIGKIRLRVGDYSDLPMFEDAVYTSALADCNNNVTRASVLMATYILALLTAQTHQKLAQIEVYGSEWFHNYVKFVKMVIQNPQYMTSCAMPYEATYKNDCGEEVELPLVEFQKNWNANYSEGTSSRDLKLSANLVC